MKEIIDLKDRMTRHLLDRFGIAPEKSTLKIYTQKEWKKFCDSELLTPRTKGVYFSGNYSAHIVYDPLLSPQLLFHEYFGHGLHDENTPLGELTHTLENKLAEDEKKAKITTPYELAIFRESNPYYIELSKLLEETRERQEGFAMWMQWYLSNVSGQTGIFRNELQFLHTQYQIGFTKILSFSETHGEEELLRNFKILK
ncbi:MAG: hypothetical protein V1914_00120 [archaeon]